ncbi:hypothetical protein [Arthrobacter sp. OV608]|uniref:hypothetical protein n=1 Tax=Arthrobacter sp. OV608 TaxID=1882768 RepID=UPI0008BF37C7|nr:hypothetical protein [Arthrobacter sp. OV608]SEP85690.1 hypothetical protein SAMN05444745_102221 [Arthrobacter sp. OV608]
MASHNTPSARWPEVTSVQASVCGNGRTIQDLPGTALPILDGGILDELEDELADYALMCRFAADYAALWKHRLGRLAAGIENHDRNGALDAAISIKVSSAMIGGLSLSLIAETLEHAIRKDILNDSALLLASLATAGEATLKEIETRYSVVGE